MNGLELHAIADTVKDADTTEEAWTTFHTASAARRCMLICLVALQSLSRTTQARAPSAWSTESEEWAVSTVRVVVLPLQRLGVLVVLADVAHELLVQVFDGGEVPRLITSRWIRENQFSTWLSHDE